MGGVFSTLMRKIKNGEFVITGEIEPEKTTNIGEILEAAAKLKGYVVAVNITDNPQGFAYMSGLLPSFLIQEVVGLEVIYQVTCRDRNRLAIFSDLLAAGSVGIRNILALTGDHVVLGDVPQGKPVFDLDAAQLVWMIRRMVDEGVDPAGNPIDNPPKFHVGVAANPNANPLEPEILKLERKVSVGAEFVQTQVVYDIEVAKRFLDDVSYLKVPIIIGICPLKSVKMAKWLDEKCPGISIPKDLMEELIRAKERGGKQAIWEVNIEYFGDFIRELRRTTRAAGVHVMAVGMEELIPPIIERAGLVKEAIDWRTYIVNKISKVILPQK
ncbi:MAG: methylenetetrahydrofolate reductase [Candidatus Baldrarchaeia archaeon]